MSNAAGVPGAQGPIVTMASIAALISVGVAVDEFDYARGHPYAYGAAKLIASGAAAGALLGVAVAALAFVAVRREA